ncbi:sulfatase family protein [Pontiella sulfatireligans]|uniref:Arylsulfatase n=1 Tax=Pontiella sulfatireligans TaxID=2750658 RepID=A0A6C2UG08_9BACT|nr:sulfatase [Pontiella sulfatireligans]SPS74150.1 sulfatase S1_8 [Kiritimatiellales bacterium]VGO18304.1 Arylsulfatase [Pontiella sulfatireligans]
MMKVNLLIGCLLLAQLTGFAKETGKPNVLFFITDDESWIERSAYGWSNLPTPHFDRVARDGVLFMNAYASAPSCAPSRAAILTGRNFWELEQGAFIQAWLPKKFPVFPALLKQAGYHTGFTRKSWGPGMYPPEGHGPDVAGQVYDEALLESPPPGIDPNDYAENFERFLADRKPGQPFFFWAGVYEPHLPWGEGNHERLANEFGVPLENVPVPPIVEDSMRNRKRRGDFLYEICTADQQLGHMLDRLESLGELENTLVVVTSDNGSVIEDLEAAIPLDRGKTTPDDLGVHEPLAVMWPAGIKAGRKVTDFVRLADFAPTFLELAGVEVPDSMSARSLRNILTSEDSGRIEPERSFIITGVEWHGEFDPASKSARTICNDRYAYIVYYANVDESGNALSDENAVKPVIEKLFDMQADPWQMNNLIDDERYTEVKQRLFEQLQAEGMRTSDPRATGEMSIFRETRDFVQQRKRNGYK